MLLEVACFSIEAAQVAISYGAQRVELCSDRESGGLTPPSPNDLKKLLDRSEPGNQVPINVMIRSNGRSTFTTDHIELEEMVASIDSFKQYASGFVFGFLQDDGSIDVRSCRRLCAAAHPLPCTFHRAFDHAKYDLQEKLRLVHEMGFTRILTSGGTGDAINGVQNLSNTVSQAKSLGLGIIVGGGVRSGNAEDLIVSTGAASLHTSAIPSGSDTVDPTEIGAIRSIMIKHM